MNQYACIVRILGAKFQQKIMAHVHNSSCTSDMYKAFPVLVHVVMEMKGWGLTMDLILKVCPEVSPECRGQSNHPLLG